MKIYRLNTFAAAIIFSLLSLGFLGLFVLLPIIFIQWAWNFSLAACTQLPSISVWQAGLLYLAGAALLYLLGIVQVEFETDSQG